MKKRIREDIRVEVTPSLWGRESEQQQEALCQGIAASIRRHVDDVGQVRVVWDSKQVCSFCGMEWEEDEDGCPVCCGGAQDEWDKVQATSLPASCGGEG